LQVKQKYLSFVVVIFSSTKIKLAGKGVFALKCIKKVCEKGVNPPTPPNTITLIIIIYKVYYFLTIIVATIVS